MLRIRRYRALLVVAIVVTISLYHITRIRNWDTQSIGVDKLKKLGHQVASTSSPAVLSSSSIPPPVDLAVPIPNLSTSPLRQSSYSPTPVQSSTLLDFSEVLATSTSTQTSRRAQITAHGGDVLAGNEAERIADGEVISDELKSYGQGRLEIDPGSAALEQPHWVPQKEHFPVPAESIIQLPTGRPKRIPAIQHVFAAEASSAKMDNRQKLDAIKEAFKHAWSGYKEYAMPHDELEPVSLGFKDPFNGWGATLVDTLDTLWIMDLKDEFEEALMQVKKIDFTTSIRKDIPLFETVIRYLGGLIAAYDISSGRYPVPLEKAVELAEILMGAFDTPNRMPVTYYHWAPSYASQPHRASSRVVLAELGTLSLEFTRLAQITKEHKYYDAAARITNELQTWQNNTQLPGLWPVAVDASGCKKANYLSTQVAHSASKGPQNLLPPIQNPPEAAVHEQEKTSPKQDSDSATLYQDRSKSKRQLDDAGFSIDEEPAYPASDNFSDGSTSSAASVALEEKKGSTMGDVDCQPQGLASPPHVGMETFTLGGMSDSTYEYLPKEWLLLGGLNNQYESMYKSAMNIVRDKLLYRPMTETGRDILFAGTLKTSGMPPDNNETRSSAEIMEYDGQHLTCFAGGMFAIGAKIFGIKDDVDIARKLTDGCIWAYESTTTGIMPEGFHLIPCASRRDCKWNGTKWWEELDPYRSIREEQAKTWYQHQKLLNQAASADEEEQAELPLHHNLPVLPTESAKLDLEHSLLEEDANITINRSVDTLRKRQSPERNMDAGAGDESGLTPTPTDSDSGESEEDDEVPAMSQFSYPAYTPKPIPTHEEFVQARIKEERIPPGFADITNRKYILRPEAIESVFIMYRVTGDEYWREQGWKMFTAIQTYTFTEHANSAINDVTSEVPFFSDSMESFWLAETLKYFYLLYSDPDLINLDDYVFNTEAHPFKRPK
ncbi:hypothetical protein EPUS_05058 [Endocarpon pusillum Z07020]|uniref:alpha-1,2-Mannosidase n=1 Tax=Endocarpon pusillum (strain Z07020 / HMAS-L-300199) TaxID=1263415 RepID=U1G6H7_ENDPU|nr:uncharacterized protein EPUS_05058 [Endocarpon pusillum Z07020]ERF72977.1 hypothetical protein EPUS_05058 [Endocarpon pusillum Z07020]